ncbi:MAG: TetR/AcrR family transcriptional regulator [Gammaproteobacteria bacterium]|nr:TetR/AcrR family transcriptional regulator [Gammaproteobacteria bacterium]
MSRDTRTRILVASLLLFNEEGEPNTTTNDIADEVDISPGNLYYHFHKKSDLVAALLAEFQADARKILQPPDAKQTSLDDFWVFLHLLLEFSSAYRFLFRDMESLLIEYPKVGNALKHFARGLAASFELYLRALARDGVIRLAPADMAATSRNLAVISLFSGRFDGLVDSARTADDSALQVASSVLNLLKPFIAADAALHLEELMSHYGV